MRNIFLATIVILIVTGCTDKRPVLIKTEDVEKIVVPKETQPLVKPIKKIENPIFSEIIKSDPKDDENFSKALSHSKEYYSKPTVLQSTFTYDDQNYTGKQMLESLELFERITDGSKTYEEFIEQLSENFDVYESKNSKNSALVTGYYAPLLRGSLEKTDKYNVPLYPVPSDIITANIKNFSSSLPSKEIVGRIDGKEMVPYYTRGQIESGALHDTKPLIYVDSKIDAFFLEVQGSGSVALENGERVNIGFAGKNGRPYSSIGNVFWKSKLIPSDKINMQTIKEYLTENTDMQSKIFNENESFVFFQIRQKAGVFGNIQVPLTAKTSVAMDNSLMPKGSLVYIKTKIPYKKNPKDNAVPREQREALEKFFIVQDTGGAIRGGGRVDIYFGEGDDAFFYAGQMADSKASVYLLVAKKEILEKGKVKK